MVENLSEELPLLTFNSLYNLLREEKRLKDKLQDLPELFYKALDKFFLEKKKELNKLSKTNDLDKLKKEKKIYLNSKKIVNDLLNLRLQKIANIAIENQINLENIFDEEFIFGKEKKFLKLIKEGVKEFILE